MQTFIGNQAMYYHSQAFTKEYTSIPKYTLHLKSSPKVNFCIFYDRDLTSSLIHPLFGSSFLLFSFFFPSLRSFHSLIFLHTQPWMQIEYGDTIYYIEQCTNIFHNLDILKFLQFKLSLFCFPTNNFHCFNICNINNNPKFSILSSHYNSNNSNISHKYPFFSYKLYHQLDIIKFSSCIISTKINQKFLYSLKETKRIIRHIKSLSKYHNDE